MRHLERVSLRQDSQDLGRECRIFFDACHNVSFFNAPVDIGSVNEIGTDCHRSLQVINLRGEVRITELQTKRGDMRHT